MSAAQKKPVKSTTRRPGRPRQMDNMAKINTASHIMQHAKSLFAQKGFSAVSIQDIVAAAEISKPTLYYYFPDKEHLYSAVLTDIIEKAGGFFTETLTPADLTHVKPPHGMEKKLLLLAEGFFDHAPASLPCLLRDVAQHLNEPTANQVLGLYREKIFKPFEKLFEAGVKDGELRSTQSPWLLSEFFLTLLDWLTLRFSFHEGTPLSSSEKARQVVKLFLDGAGTLSDRP